MYSEHHNPRPRQRKRSRHGGAGAKAHGGNHRFDGVHVEQPLPSQEGAEPCPRCGFPVEPRRLHFHMVRFHGETLRQKGG